MYNWDLSLINCVGSCSLKLDFMLNPLLDIPALFRPISVFSLVVFKMSRLLICWLVSANFTLIGWILHTFLDVKIKNKLICRLTKREDFNIHNTKVSSSGLVVGLVLRLGKFRNLSLKGSVREKQSWTFLIWKVWKFAFGKLTFSLCYKKCMKHLIYIDPNSYFL